MNVRSIGVALALLALGAGAQAQTLERVRASGTLKIGYVADEAPFSYQDEQGRAAGYMVDLCRVIAADVATRLELPEPEREYVAVTTDNRFEALQDGRIDILCAATTQTLARRELVDFSLPTFIDGAGVLLRADSPKDFESLAGMKVGVHGATTTERALRGTLEQQKIAAEVVTVDSHEDGLEQLQAGAIQAYFADRGILTYLLLESEDKGLWLAERQFTYEPYALALARGDDDFRLLVDRALSRLYRTDAIDQLFTAAFGPKARQSELVKALYAINGLPE